MDSAFDYRPGFGRTLTPMAEESSSAYESAVSDAYSPFKEEKLSAESLSHSPEIKPRSLCRARFDLLFV
jgi:hypothetical protein